MDSQSLETAQVIEIPRLGFFGRAAARLSSRLNESNARIDDLVPRMRALEAENASLVLRLGLRDEAARKALASGSAMGRMLVPTERVAMAAQHYVELVHVYEPSRPAENAVAAAFDHLNAALAAWKATPGYAHSPSS